MNFDVWRKRSLSVKHEKGASGSTWHLFSVQHISQTRCLEKDSGLGNRVIQCNYVWQAQTSNSVYSKRGGYVSKRKTKVHLKTWGNKSNIPFSNPFISLSVKHLQRKASWLHHCFYCGNIFLCYFPQEKKHLRIERCQQCNKKAWKIQVQQWSGAMLLRDSNWGLMLVGPFMTRIWNFLISLSPRACTANISLGSSAKNI